MTIGDTVRLKSGGPLMTINNESQMTGGFLCCWFGEREFNEAWFARDAVEPAVDIHAKKKKAVP